jgi:hypothetical protein
MTTRNKSIDNANHSVTAASGASHMAVRPEPPPHFLRNSVQSGPVSGCSS